MGCRRPGAARFGPRSTGGLDFTSRSQPKSSADCDDIPGGQAARIAREMCDNARMDEDARRLGLLPNFLVIGAQRAGTSLLHRILQHHSEVYVPWRRKELHYFDLYYDRGLDWYRSYFPPASKARCYCAIGEVTPDYLAIPVVPARIHAILPGCRLIAILRDPVDRAHSWYQYARHSRNERRDFETFLAQEPRALECGLYHRHLQRYLGFFKRDSMLVLIYEEFVADPSRELARLADFLGLSVAWPNAASLLEERVNTENPRFRGGYALARNLGNAFTRYDLNWPVRVAKNLGVHALFGRGPPPPPLDAAVRTWLAGYYRDDVGKLRAFLQTEIPDWRL